jgi:hypothetical protein
MLWNVEDNGKVFVRLKSEGVGAQMLDRDGVNRYIGNIVGDLAATQGIDIVTNELRVSFSKTRPEVNVTWRAEVPPDRATDVREYMMRMSQEAPGD